MVGRWWNLLPGPGIPSWITRRLRQDTFHLSHSSTERCLWFLELTQAFAPPMCDNWNNVNLKCCISSISKENYQTSKPSLTVRNCFCEATTNADPQLTPHHQRLMESSGAIYGNQVVYCTTLRVNMVVGMYVWAQPSMGNMVVYMVEYK